MPVQRITQYQISANTFFTPTQPPFPSYAESNWHQPWSEPVRFKIAKGLAIALAASGQFAPVLNPETQIIQQYESRWHYAWSEPVRQKIGIHASRQPFFFMKVDRPPFFPFQVLYQNLAEPVRNHRTLPYYLQQSYAAPDRLLPPADITMTMAAIEINTDAVLFGIDVTTIHQPVYVSIAGANVSIREIGTDTGEVSTNDGE